ncbi:MAG: anhydro-N-acetylmuramic acid kinase [Oleiphilaceae bacterium]|nr:anhydro-N-acetylmuramic acid kinase [Oleiphilaceae bacterium]
MSTRSSSTLYIGLMSGTSMDGMDAVLVDLSSRPPRTLAHHQAHYPPETLSRLNRLVDNHGHPDDMGEADTRIAEHFAQCVQSLLAQSNTPASAVRAIGSHGQTVRHRPDSSHPFTLQLGDPNVIAERTGMDVVADFRRRDMAAGGQGAPLAPAFHQWCFAQPEQDRALVNIGGMANMTWLPSGGEVLGCDTGPGNRLMDLWCCRHRGQPYDEGGLWAASGHVLPALLEQMLEDPYFQRSGPRSTGREHFNGQWLYTHLEDFPDARPEDVQRTLMALTVSSIRQSLQRTGNPDALFVCGGGAYNQTLMAELAEAMAPCPVQSTETLGVDPQCVEGAAFAWLAMRHLAAQPGNLPAVTGARGERILGVCYPGQAPG